MPSSLDFNKIKKRQFRLNRTIHFHTQKLARGRIASEEKRERERGIEKKTQTRTQRNAPEFLGRPKLTSDRPRVVHHHVDAAPNRDRRLGPPLHLRERGRHVELQQSEPVFSFSFPFPPPFVAQRRERLSEPSFKFLSFLSSFLESGGSCSCSCRSDDPIAACEDAPNEREAESGGSAYKRQRRAGLLALALGPSGLIW